MYSIHAVVQVSFVKQHLDCAFGNSAITALYALGILYIIALVERKGKDGQKGL